MAEREIFQTFGLQGIDAKGRVGIPADLRMAIERNSDGARQLRLALNRGSRFLTGTDTGQAKDAYQELLRAKERALDADREIDTGTVGRRMFGLTEVVPFDASGRFVLTPYFRAKAELADQAFFIGIGPHFEIWNPDVLLADSAIEDDVKDLVQFLRSQRGAA